MVEGPGIGCPREGIRQSTGGLPGRRGFLYRSGDRPRGGFRYRYGNEGLLFSQGWTQVGSQGLLLGLDFAVVEFVVAAELVVVARGLVVVVARSLLLLLERRLLHRLMLRGLL